MHKVTGDEELEVWFGNVIVCFYKDGSNLNKVISEIRLKGLRELVVNEFNSFSCIVSRVECLKDCPSDNSIKQKLKECFQNIFPLGLK